MIELKINKNKVKKKLDEELKYSMKFAGEFETVAKCYLYLEKIEESKEYFEKAIENIEVLAHSFKEKNSSQFYSEKRLSTANYYRILSRYEEMKGVLLEIESIYRTLYTGKIKEMPDTFRRFYFEWCTILFHLGKYEEAYKIGKLIRHGTIAPRGYAKGLLKNDELVIENTLEEIIKDIKDERLQPFHNATNVDDLWEWYEIGRQLLGLPSVLDMFREDSK